MTSKSQSWNFGKFSILIFIALLPLVIVALVLSLFVNLFFYIAVWCCWCTRGRYVLFVYSDSPIWKDYIEENILPRLKDRMILLNWSQRLKWRFSLPVLVFNHIGGDREFNPMAMVFRPFRLAKKFRFYEPFREFKDGNDESLKKMEKELFQYVFK